jgi:hypothetical protein
VTRDLWSPRTKAGKHLISSNTFRTVQAEWGDGPRLTPNDVTEVFDLLRSFEYFVQSRNLNEPSQIVREQFVVNNPFCKLVPLVDVSSIDTQTPFDILVFALLCIIDHLCAAIGSALQW